MKYSWLILPLLAALTLAACSSSTRVPASVNVTVTANKLKFTPATLEVVAGQRVTLALQNTDPVDHDLVIMELPLEEHAAETTEGHMEGHGESDMMETEAALHVTAGPGATSTVAFTPIEAGSYEMVCTVPGHRAAGMVGTLVVRGR